LFYVFKGCFGGVDKEISYSEMTRISEPFSTSNGVVHIHIIRWWIFPDSNVEIFNYPGLFAALSEGLNKLQDIFGIGIKLLGKCGNESFSLGCTIISI